MISPWMIGNLTIRKHQKRWPFHHSRPNEYWKYLKMRRYQNLAIKFGCWFSFDFMLISKHDGRSLLRKVHPSGAQRALGHHFQQRHLATDLVRRNLHRSRCRRHGVIFVGNWMRSIDGLGPMNPRFSTIHQCNESGSKSKQQQVNASSKIRIKVISHKQIKIRVRIKPNWKSESESIQIQSR